MDLLQSSLKMGERLKELRQSKNLSFYGLSAAIKERYGVDISHDSLRNYEISERYSANAGKNNGMSLKNLKCLAAFYGVSADYLLGLSDADTNDYDLARASDYLGLPRKCVEILKQSNRGVECLLNSPNASIYLNTFWQIKFAAAELLSVVADTEQFDWADFEGHSRTERLREQEHLLSSHIDALGYALYRSATEANVLANGIANARNLIHDTETLALEFIKIVEAAEALEMWGGEDPADFNSCEEMWAPYRETAAKLLEENSFAKLTEEITRALTKVIAQQRRQGENG